MTDVQLMTTAEVAELMRCSPETVLRWHKQKRLPGGARMPGGALRFRRNVLEEWLQAGGQDADGRDDAAMNSSLHAVGAR